MCVAQYALLIFFEPATDSAPGDIEFFSYVCGCYTR